MAIALLTSIHSLARPVVGICSSFELIQFSLDSLACFACLRLVGCLVVVNGVANGLPLSTWVMLTLANSDRAMEYNKIKMDYVQW